MIDEPMLLETTDQIVAEILYSDVSVALFHCRNIHAMECNNPTGLCKPEKVFNKKTEVQEKLIIVFTVAHVAFGVDVGVKTAEWR